MPRISAAQAGGQNVTAFMDMVAVSEIGAEILADPRSDDGYKIIVGSTPKKLILMKDYEHHPRLFITIDGERSSAAGRYQYIVRTWVGLVMKLHLPDISPISQDRACLELFRQRHALDAIKAGQFEEAVHLCRQEWASLPGAGYDQHENKIEYLQAAYQAAGGVIA